MTTENMEFIDYLIERANATRNDSDITMCNNAIVLYTEHRSVTASEFEQLYKSWMGIPRSIVGHLRMSMSIMIMVEEGKL